MQVTLYTMYMCMYMSLTCTHIYSILSIPIPHQALPRSKYSETLLVLYGQYSSIFILDSTSLDTLCVLRSSCKPNWNSHITFLINPEKKGVCVCVCVCLRVCVRVCLHAHTPPSCFVVCGAQTHFFLISSLRHTSF